MDPLSLLLLNFVGCMHALTFYLIETPFNAFANRADTDQAALIRVYSVCSWKYDISDPT